MTYYPDEHHPIFFLRDALRALGAEAEFNHRDERTLGCWGLIVNGKPMVWLIDNRHPHEAAKEDPAARELLARGVLVCHAQKPDMERVGGKWLPLAATPGYKPFEPRTITLKSNSDSREVQVTEHDKWYDVGFVGYIRDTGRSMLFADIGARYSLNTGEGLFGRNAVEAYWFSRIGVNIPTGYGAPDCYDINMRVFEIMATGVPLVTNTLPELAELGITHADTAMLYDSPDHLIWLIGKLLEHPDKANEMGNKASQLVQEHHTYRHRAEQVLEWLN